MHKDDEQRAIRPEDLEELLGRQVSRHDRAQEDNPPGVVTGLAWTPVGGEILFIEATDMPGSGQVILTGQLGDVMKESARISLSLLKSRLPLDTGNLSDRDIHIHVPSGAVSKDGPSAGIAPLYGVGFPVYRAEGRSSSGHDRRNHPAGSGAFHRRTEGKASGRPAGRYYEGADSGG